MTSDIHFIHTVSSETLGVLLYMTGLLWNVIICDIRKVLIRKKKMIEKHFLYVRAMVKHFFIGFDQWENDNN